MYWGALLALSGCISTATIPNVQVLGLNGLGDPTSAEAGQRRVVADVEGEPWIVQPGDELILCSPVLAAPANEAWRFNPRTVLGTPEPVYTRETACGLAGRFDTIRLEGDHFVGRRAGYRVVDVPLAAVDHVEIEYFDTGQTLLLVGCIAAASAALVGLAILTGANIYGDSGGAQFGP